MDETQSLLSVTAQVKHEECSVEGEIRSGWRDRERLREVPFKLSLEGCSGVDAVTVRQQCLCVWGTETEVGGLLSVGSSLVGRGWVFISFPAEVPSLPLVAHGCCLQLESALLEGKQTPRGRRPRPGQLKHNHMGQSEKGHLLPDPGRAASAPRWDSHASRVPISIGSKDVGALTLKGPMAVGKREKAAAGGSMGRSKGWPPGTTSPEQAFGLAGETLPNLMRAAHQVARLSDWYALFCFFH